jgi:hypothetical protein
MKVLEWLYLTVIATPILLFADWYGRNYVGEYIDDYPENPRPFKLSDNQGPLDDDLVNCPPVGSPEWDDWVGQQKETPEQWEKRHGFRKDLE